MLSARKFLFAGDLKILRGNYSENSILLDFIYLAIYIFFSAYQRPHLGCITVKARLYQGRLKGVT